MRRAAAHAGPPLDGVDLLLADLDGVVYAGKDAIPHAVDALNDAARERAVAYITNNASRTDAAVAEQLRGFGLTVRPEDVVTSPQAAIRLLAGLVPTGSTVLVVGGEGLTVELDRAGFRWTRSADDAPVAVVQGFAPEVGWRDLAEASYALAGPDPIPWVATNTDWTIPQERGVAPGNGTLVSAVHTATGLLPTVAGKPERAIFDAAVARFGGTHPLFVGDRLDTDVLGANRAGITSALVLTGIDGGKQLVAAAPDQRPDLVLEDLRDLARPYAAVETRDRRGRTEFRCGTALVVREGTTVRVEAPGERAVETLRAGASAVWTSEHSLYALEVDPRIYS